MWKQVLIASGALLATNVALAESGGCASIADPAARLACYDRANTPAVAPPAAAAPAPITPTAPPPATDSFGAENLPAEAADRKAQDAIESRISGLFEGWTRDTEFRLDNGQVWRCANCRDVYYRVENPAVTVKRGFMGSYWLKVEGLNTQASVKRIK